MTVLTISRQLGTHGLSVAQKAAEQLGYHLYWREVINRAALDAGAPEMALAVIDELGLFDLCPSQAMCDAYHQAVQEVMAQFATEGNAVIVGRAGQVILKEWPDAFHVRIFAPAEFRAASLVETHGIRMEAAFAQIHASDEYRRDYLQRFYGVRWDDPNLYDLLINIARLSIDTAASMICEVINLQNTETEKNLS